MSLVGKVYFAQDAQFGDSDLTFRFGVVNYQGNDGYSVTHNFGPDVSIVYTATGVYTVTMDRKYHELRGAFVSPILSATTDITSDFDLDDTDLENTDTMVVKFKTAGSAANLPSGAKFFLGFVHKDVNLPDGV